MTKIKYAIAQRVSDDRQNQLIVRVNKEETRLKIHLKLAAEADQRRVAEVDLKEKKMYMKREHGKHYHYTSKSYGFNWTVLNQCSGWDTLVLTVRYDDADVEMFAIPRKVLIQQGRVLNFNSKGFELQKFVPLSVIQEYKVKGDFIVK